MRSLWDAEAKVNYEILLFSLKGYGRNVLHEVQRKNDEIR